MASPRSRPAPFRPQITLLLLYFFAFFLLFCVLFVAFDLFVVLSELEPGPNFEAEARQRGKDAAYAAIEGKLPLAFLGALAVMVLGAWTRRFPGMRSRP